MAAKTLDRHFNTLEAQLKALDGLFISHLNHEYLNHSEILETIRTHLNSIADMIPGLDEGIEKHDQITKFHLQNLAVLKKHFISISSESFLHKINNEFTIATNQYLINTPEILGIEYPLESFKPIKGDPLWIKMSYSLERGFIKLQKGFRTITNLFLRPTKRKEKKSDSRMLNVHFRKVIQGYLLPLYIAQISEIVKERQKLLVESYLGLFDLENAFVKNSYAIQNEEISRLEANNIRMNADMSSDFLDKHKKELEVLLQRSGMLLSMNFWRNLGRNRDFNKSRENLLNLNKAWQSTFFAFFEDWRFREQLFAYIHSVQSAQLNMWSIYTQRIKNSLIPEVEKQLEYTSTLLGCLPDPDISDMEKIRSFFISELYRLKKGSRTEEEQKKVLQAAEDIPKLLQKLENELSEKLEIFNEKVGVVSKPIYINGVKPSDIYYFSPGKFIEFECIRDLSNELASQRTQLKDELHIIINEFSEYDQILDFYLDSTISLTENPGMNETEVLSFFKEGLHRLLKISERISELLNCLQNEELAELSGLLKKYLERVSELNKNDNIINIYARLLKSKAIAESKSKQKKLVDFAKRTYSKSTKVINEHTRWLRTSYSDLKRKLKLDISSGTISPEVSNQLTDIQHQIYTLPVIYQHLFENIPIKEFNLFLSRENEISKLNAVYDNWLKDKFAASLVIGENGSGKSSLLHYYSKTFKSNYQVHLFQVSRFYYTEKDYYTFIGEIFNQADLSSDQSIETFISSFKDRRIVIIDGMERLFIRKVSGFECLVKLLSLIVSTNRQVLWICSVSKYASAYLNKTISLLDYFDYSIHLDSLTSKQIQSIVLKRNRLSGFQVSYQMRSSSDGNARPKKLTQADLEDTFFNELSLFAGSNISLSLNYWLQSIKSIQGDLIEIGNFVTPDFSFLENISLEKVYTLLAVVMHGKISVEHHALTFNQKPEKSYKVLTILKEDSILVKQGEYFILNGILFRHVVRILENKNLIH